MFILLLFSSYVWNKYVFLHSQLFEIHQKNSNINRRKLQLDVNEIFRNGNTDIKEVRNIIFHSFMKLDF